MTRTKRSFAELQRRSPTRSPAWRWERAQALVREGRRVSRKRDDGATALAVSYLRALQRCRHQRSEDKLARTFPDVHAAHHLHERGGNTAVEVQARLLARQSFEEVARRTSVPVEAVKCYEALFFHVSDRLHARDWIALRAMGWLTFDPATGRDPATVLRAYAYHGGPILLDASLEYLLGNRMGVPSGLDPASPEGRLDRSLRRAVLLEMAPWGAKTDTKLIKQHAELLADARKEASAAQEEAVVGRNAAEVLANLAAEALRRCPALGGAAVGAVHDPETRGTAQVG